MQKNVDSNEKRVNLNASFANKFNQMANDFINNLRTNTKTVNKSYNILHNMQIDNILMLILRFLYNQTYLCDKSPIRKRDVALKKAIDLINNKTEEVLTLNQLCQFTGVCERTLEYAFLEKFQVTPKEFIKATKINKIRNELMVYDGQDIKIFSIAAKYGFWHMGNLRQIINNGLEICHQIQLKENCKTNSRPIFLISLLSNILFFF